ncbi:Activator of Hsp90 ATPase, N-terminal [Seminavis robusta]|uniref:Activator of Hsp90 ATPase, N-terminal n=1 Tax=Seminavis robusta TaxID=568900 RepID=A0A9N8HZM8_9STRA|nr:Activator of Hsp90 ATPase, N-terminal [Seminavis robusta]|eukprot:Sro3000_g341940.1 Activator of Hsp90 ATPase, N-terminal (439) ;mRNA; r:5018-6334
MNVNPMFQNSAHRDVLGAPIPDTESSQRGLLEELKNRGRSAVGGKAWPDAQLLYEKAIQVVDALDSSATPNERAILHSNLSLVLAKMGKFKEAKTSAQQATEVDRTYVKGWWRLGQAMSSLKDFEGAVEAMEKAMLLDPNNKALTKELNKLREEAANAANKMEEDEKENGPKTEPAPPRSEIYKPKPNTAKPNTTATATTATTSKPTGSTSSTTTPMAVDEDDKNLFSKSDQVRGYKIVNGKKTSYFHNELSEEAKQLIGDIAPKKIDPASAAPAPAATGDKSSWNHAGTWEERDVTGWAKESLQQFLLKATYTFPASSPAPGAIARIESVKKIDGHASFATVRSKKKYIYEFAVTGVEWTLDLPDGNIDAVKGKLNFPDIDGTCELGEGYDVTNFEITAIEEQSLRPVVDRFVHRSGLRDALHQAIDDWVRHFREKY